MKLVDYLVMMGSIVVTIICWGTYGPVLHWGQQAMDGSRMRPFLCVGVAYFLLAVVVPMIYLTVAEEAGTWTTKGVIWSTLAGLAGALGALGIIFALKSGGKPHNVMPLVFGGAPVINTLWTITALRINWRDIHPLYYAGLILVITGAAAVLIAAPRSHPKTVPGTHAPAEAEATPEMPESRFT